MFLVQCGNGRKKLAVRVWRFRFVQLADTSTCECQKQSTHCCQMTNCSHFLSECGAHRAKRPASHRNEAANEVSDRFDLGIGQTNSFGLGLVVGLANDILDLEK